MRSDRKKFANLLPAEANRVDFEKVGDHAGICRQAGLVVHYEGVLLPDGKRSSVMRMADPEHLRYRRLDASGNFVYGKVAYLKANQRKKFVTDLVFRDDRVQSIPFSEDEKIVIGALRKCDSILRSVVLNKFADRLFGAFTGNTWLFPGLKFALDARSAGKVIAELRGKNECYTDFSHSGSKGIVRESTRIWLESCGFELLSLSNRRMEAKQVCKLLELYESRSAGDNPPEWFSHWIGMDMWNDYLTKRMHLCCFRNRVTLEEWEEFLNLLPNYGGIMAGNGKTGKPLRRGSKSRKQVNQI